MSLGHHLVALPSSNETSDKLGSFKIPFEPFSTYVTLKNGFKQLQVYKHTSHIYICSLELYWKFSEEYNCFLKNTL